MADVSELLAAEAHRLQPDTPPPFEELLHVRRMRDRRTRMAAGSLMLLVLVGGVTTSTLFLGEGSTRSTTVGSSGRAVSATPGPGSVTARLTLSATSVRAGGSLSGQITVENNSGEPIRAGGCGSIYQVSLVGGDHQGARPSPDCLEFFTIPVGQSTYPVRVPAAYDSCSNSTNKPRPCPDDGSMPPLPYGEYAATTFAGDDDTPLPAPIMVTVTP
jgi:hypothetical protein